jgi:hypothetical protein
VNGVDIDQSADFVTAPIAATLLFRGQISGFHDRLPLSGQTVDIWLRRASTGQVLRTTVTTFFGGYFTTSWTMSQFQAGQFTVGASHPSNPDRSQRQGPGVIINNLRVVSTPSALGVPGTFLLQGQVENMGDMPLRNVRVGFPAQVTVPNFLVNLAFGVPTEIEPRSMAGFNVSFTVLGPVVVYWFDAVVSSDDLSRQMLARININVREPEARLTASPVSLQRRQW